MCLHVRALNRGPGGDGCRGRRIWACGRELWAAEFHRSPSPLPLDPLTAGAEGRPGRKGHRAALLLSGSLVVCCGALSRHICSKPDTTLGRSRRWPRRPEPAGPRVMVTGGRGWTMRDMRQRYAGYSVMVHGERRPIGGGVIGCRIEVPRAVGLPGHLAPCIQLHRTVHFELGRTGPVEE